MPCLAVGFGCLAPLVSCVVLLQLLCGGLAGSVLWPCSVSWIWDLRRTEFLSRGGVETHGRSRGTRGGEGLVAVGVVLKVWKLGRGRRLFGVIVF